MFDPSVPALPAPPASRGESARSRGWAAVGLVAAVAVGVVVGRVVVGAVGEAARPPGLVAGLLVSVPLVLALHEAGHVAGGALARFQFLLYVVGPLRVERAGGGRGLRARFNRDLALWGGLAASAPTDDRDLRRRTALLVAGGPAVSVLSALVAGAGWAALGNGPAAEDPFRGALLAFAGLSAAIAVVTLWPMTTGGFLTDGARLLRLLRGGPTAESEGATSVLMGRSMGGERPRDWPTALVDSAASGAGEDLMGASAQMLAYSHRLDCGEPGAARDHLAQALALWNAVPSAVRPTWAAEAAFFEAAVRHDVAAAERWLAKVGERGGLLASGTAERARAAGAALQGDADGARTWAEAARAALATSTDPGGAAAERDWLDRAVSDPSPAPPGRGG